MIPLVDLAGWAVAAVAGVPCLVLSAELAAGLAPGQDRTRPAPARTVIIIPAHDEAEVLEPTLRALQSVAPPDCRILVVADNCTDQTAAIARRCGAQVLERTDPVHRGKGHALAAARDHLAAAPEQPEVVIVLDADCRIAAGGIERLAGACLATGRPAQARNLLEPPPGAGPLVQISCFAFMVKNLVRARGLARLSGAVTLMGTGMAFPWPLFSGLPLASSHVAEDMELGVELIRRGQGALLVPSAHVTSPPAAERDTLEQRRRWEHGFLSVALRQAFPLIAEGVGKGRPALVALGLHLLVPPLALMAALVLGACALLLAASMAVAMPLQVRCVEIASGLAAALLLAAWAAYGRKLLRPAAMLRIPLYIFWKLPLYLGFLTRRETRWIRTRRM